MSLFDPKGGHGVDPGPVTIEIPGKTAMLLMRIAEDMQARTPGEVVAHALGLLEIIRQAKARGQRIILRDPGNGREVDLAL